MNAADLIRWARDHREGVPDGNLSDRAVLVEVLQMLLTGHLERTEPQPEPDRIGNAPSGFYTIRGAAPPARTPETCDQTSHELATLIGYLLEDSQS